MLDIDHPAVDAGVEALFGQHPERGGIERRQAVFVVLHAAAPFLKADWESPTKRVTDRDRVKLFLILMGLMAIALGVLVGTAIQLHGALDAVKSSRTSQCRQANARRSSALAVHGLTPVEVKIIDAALPHRDCGEINGG